MGPKFHRKVLSNGLTLLFEKRDTPVVSVAFAVRCGGINESLNEKGISHFIEHMLYKGTTTRTAHQIAEEIEKRGGDLNGFTDEAVTAYWCKMPSKHLNVALDVLSDMVKNPLFDAQEMEKEKRVIIEEIKMRRDNPQTFVADTIHSFLYKNPFGFHLAGSEKTLSGMTREKVLERFRDVYQPKNMILCVVGNADFDSIVKFAEKNFTEKNSTAKIPTYKIEKKDSSGIQKRRGIDQANLILAHHIPIAEDKRSYAGFVLNVLLAGGMSSRLFREIREKRNLAYAVKGIIDVSKEFAYSMIYVGTNKENVPKVKDLILDEYKKVSEGLSEKELAQVKDQVIGNFQISTEDSQVQLANLLMNEINGNAKELYEFEKHIRAVKLKDVQKLAAEVKGKDYSFFALVPE